MPLTVQQKYATNYRVDQANFGEVRKTTFAKGVIKDFQQVAAYYLKVTSLVKVEVDGVESDFIPIFYHPKKYYWDTLSHGAQDLNADGKYHENAWMSFQVNDEVVVLLQEGKPIAVIGFADGIPKIGENILKVEVSSAEDEAGETFPMYWAAAGTRQDGGPGCIYSREEQGPDGVDLKLTKGFTGTLGEIETISKTYWEPLHRTFPTYMNPSFSWLCRFRVDGTYVDPSNWAGYTGDYLVESIINFYYKYTITVKKRTLTFGPIAIGPIDYYFTFTLKQRNIVYEPNILYFIFSSEHMIDDETHNPPDEHGIVYPSPPNDPDNEINKELKPPDIAYETDPATWPLNVGTYTTISNITGQGDFTYGPPNTPLLMTWGFTAPADVPPGTQAPTPPDQHWDIGPRATDDGGFTKMAINGKEPAPFNFGGFTWGASLLYPEDVTYYVRPHNAEGS